MKKLGTLAIILTLAGITFVSLQGCKEKTTQSASKGSSLGTTESAEPTSFKEVTSKLDAGGSLYMYLGTEQWLKSLSAQVEKVHQMVAGLPEMDEKRQDVDNAFNVGNRLIKDSGLENISGIGLSSIAREPGFYRNKIVVHHYAGQGNGFIWSIFGKEPHELDGLNLLPANTAMAAFYDIDAAEIWSVIQKQCEQSGFPQAQEFLKEFPQEFEKNAGMKWDDLVNSLGGEVGIVVTMDDSHMVRIPLPTQQPVEMPEPAFMFVIKVKNDAIFNRIDALLKEKKAPGMVSSDQNGVHMRTVPFPLPVTVTLRPTVASGGGYLFISTTDGLVQEALAVKGGKPGLKSTEEFKKLSRDIPLQGNQFAFLSQRFGKNVMKVQQQVLNSNGQMPAQLKEFMESLNRPDKAAFTFAVGANTDEGWMTVANGNQGSGSLIAASAVVPAVMAGMALPALAKAKARAQSISCINNLRTIESAKNQWAMEKSKPASAVPQWQDLQPYLINGKTPTCPQGGHYNINAVSEMPTCSFPGHVLPKTL